MSTGWKCAFLHNIFFRDPKWSLLWEFGIRHRCSDPPLLSNLVILSRKKRKLAITICESYTVSMTFFKKSPFEIDIVTKILYFTVSISQQIVLTRFECQGYSLSNLTCLQRILAVKKGLLKFRVRNKSLCSANTFFPTLQPILNYNFQLKPSLKRVFSNFLSKFKAVGVNYTNL